MKDIGQKLKLKREENGLAIEEVAADLKLRPNQLNSIENGDKDDFKDVFELKNIISDYAKYLGLDGEKLIDEFNEYMFDCTSRISLSAIQEAMNTENSKDKKVSSPYTVKRNNKRFYIFAGICVLIVILVFVICLIVR
jgi:cytoskeletal protein RodZ